MIISKTPLRVSFVGGGTDLASFYEKDYGAVLSSTIDKYVYVIVKVRFDDLIYVNWTKKEIVESPDEIEHDLVREAIKKAGIEKAVEVTTIADIPSEGSGLGSSSSLTVGLLNAFYTFKGIQVSRERLAKEACEIEIDIIRKPIGRQDQYAAVFGGLNEILFYKDGSAKVNNIKLPDLMALSSKLLLFYTNITRKADNILKKQKENIDVIFKTLLDMRNQVPLLKNYLENGANGKLGLILKQGWEMKKSLLSEISNEYIDYMYERALNTGARGGKICGAGGGGFLLLYVPKEKQDAVRTALREYREIPFILEKYGSRIIFNQMTDYWR